MLDKAGGYWIKLSRYQVSIVNEHNIIKKKKSWLYWNSSIAPMDTDWRFE